QCSRRGRWRRLEKLWNVVPVHPFPSAGGEALVFVGHLVLGRLGGRVVDLLGQPTRFLCPEMPVQCFGNLSRYLIHSRLSQPELRTQPHSFRCCLQYDQKPDQQKQLYTALKPDQTAVAKKRALFWARPRSRSDNATVPEPLLGFCLG